MHNHLLCKQEQSVDIPQPHEVTPSMSKQKAWKKATTLMSLCKVEMMNIKHAMAGAVSFQWSQASQCQHIQLTSGTFGSLCCIWVQRNLWWWIWSGQRWLGARNTGNSIQQRLLNRMMLRTSCHPSMAPQSQAPAMKSTGSKFFFLNNIISYLPWTGNQQDLLIKHHRSYWI